MHLPVEIWSTIIDCLPSSQQRTCLFVSRLHHDLALRVLFSVIKIYFVSQLSGLPGEEETSLMIRSWEILYAIVYHRSLATAVKTIVVHALHAPGTSEMIFERGTLNKALEFVPHLKAFQWVGSFPTLPEDVASALATFCPDLRQLKIPFDTPHTSTRHLTKLRHLTRLQLSSSSFVPSIYDRDEMDHSAETEQEDLECFCLDGVLDLIDANSATLRELDLFGPHISDIPIRFFGALTHLEIRIPIGGELRGLNLVFHHTACLESLVLAGAIGFDVFQTLQTNSVSLPSLSSFQLSSINEFHTWEEYEMVHEFVRGRTELRRLSLRLCAPWSTVCMVVPAIKQMSAIRTLGLHMGDGELPTMADFAFLAGHLPNSLEALHLAIPCNDDFMDSSKLNPLLEVLEQLPSLSFLHLFGIGYYLPLTAEDLACTMKHLRVVGRQHRLWDVFRVDSEETLSQWRLRRMKWRTTDDFAGEDGEWLLRYF